MKRKDYEWIIAVNAKQNICKEVLHSKDCERYVSMISVFGAAHESA